MAGTIFEDMLKFHFENRYPLEWKLKDKIKKELKLYDENGHKISQGHKMKRETVSGYPLNISCIADVISQIGDMDGIRNMHMFSAFRETPVNKKFESLGWSGEAENLSLKHMDIQHLPFISIEAVYDNPSFWKIFHKRTIENIKKFIEFSKSWNLIHCYYHSLSFFEMEGLVMHRARDLFDLRKSLVSTSNPHETAFFMDHGVLKIPLAEWYYGGQNHLWASKFDSSKLIHFGKSPSYTLEIMIKKPALAYNLLGSCRYSKPHISLFLKLDNTLHGEYTIPDCYAEEALGLINEAESLSKKIYVYLRHLQSKSMPKLDMRSTDDQLIKDICKAKGEYETKKIGMESELVLDTLRFYRIIKE